MKTPLLEALELLTHSRLAAYRACPRKHHLLYERGYRPVRPASALAFGTACHAALEAYWNARKREDPWDTWAHVAIRALWAATEGMDRFDQSRLFAMVMAYISSWDAPLPGGVGVAKVLEVEAVFRCPILHPETGVPSRVWQLGGKLDAVVRLTDGRVAILEHKTTSAEVGAGSAYRQRLALDGQVSQYFMGAAALGYDASLVIYDVLVKPRCRPLKATPEFARKYLKDGSLSKSQRLEDETPEEYEVRCVEEIAENPAAYLVHAEVVRLEEERGDYLADVWAYGEAMTRAARAGASPRNPDACFRYNQPCEFWPVCSRRASISDPTLYRRVDGDVNEELAPAGDGRDQDGL